MPKGYHHLTEKERYTIYLLMQSGESLSAIAERLRRGRWTISREVRRNRGKFCYHYLSAQKRAEDRRVYASKEPWKMTHGMIRRIETRLKALWSPEQIAGRLTLEGFPISHETIYKHVWKNKRRGGTLYLRLRHGGKKYYKRQQGHKSNIRNRVDITKRPALVEKKERIGDWELDTIIGSRHKGAIVSMVDRASKYTKLSLVRSKTAEDVTEAVINALGGEAKAVLTLTSDNGKEFAYHEKIAKALDADFYFASAYHPWERGLNEHTNGLVRQYYGKSCLFATLTESQVEETAKQLNNRHRKVLGYRTPAEVFRELKMAS